jgi:hypothetical protein
MKREGLAARAEFKDNRTQALDAGLCDAMQRDENYIELIFI